MEIVGPQQQVPVGVSVLVVTNDINLTNTVHQMWFEVRSRYHFTTWPHGLDSAFDLLSESSKEFDVILVDDHRVAGIYEFLQRVKDEINIPIIMTSFDKTKNSIVKAMNSGACDYWTRPLQQKDFNNMWQHVAKEDLTFNKNTKKKRKRMRNKITSKTDDDENSPSPAIKKTRFKWSPQPKEEFEKAVTQLGSEAVPKKILEKMNVPGLTREQVASHLQKYRNHLRNTNQELQNGGSVELPALPLQMSSSSIQWPNSHAAAAEQTLLPYGNNIPQVSSNIARNNINNFPCQLSNKLLMMIEDDPASSKYGGGAWSHPANNNVLMNAMELPQPPSTNIYQFNYYNVVNPNCNMVVSHHDQGNNSEAASASGGCNWNNNPIISQVFRYDPLPPPPLQIQQVPFPNSNLRNGANLMISSPSPAAQLEILEPSSVSTGEFGSENLFFGFSGYSHHATVESNPFNPSKIWSTIKSYISQMMNFFMYGPRFRR